MKKIIVINLDLLRPKFAYFEDDTCVKETIGHNANEIRQFQTIWDQKSFALKGDQKIFVEETSYKRGRLGCICQPAVDIQFR